MRSLLQLLCAASVPVVAAASADESEDLRWTKRNLFVGPFENYATADLNKDGHVDIVYGPYWFSGPDFVPHAYRANYVGSAYHRNNSDHVLDVDQYGSLDII